MGGAEPVEASDRGSRPRFAAVAGATPFAGDGDDRTDAPSARPPPPPPPLLLSSCVFAVVWGLNISVARLLCRAGGGGSDLVVGCGGADRHRRCKYSLPLAGSWTVLSRARAHAAPRGQLWWQSTMVRT